MTQLNESHKPDIISSDGFNAHKQMQTTPTLRRKYQISCNFKNFRKTINFLRKVLRSVDSSYQTASGSIRLDCLVSKMAKRGTNSFSNTLNAFISKCIFSTYLVLWRSYSIIICLTDIMVRYQPCNTIQFCMPVYIMTKAFMHTLNMPRPYL